MAIKLPSLRKVVNAFAPILKEAGADNPTVHQIGLLLGSLVDDEAPGDPIKQVLDTASKAAAEQRRAAMQGGRDSVAFRPER